jgi:hypothetical protein
VYVSSSQAATLKLLVARTATLPPSGRMCESVNYFPYALRPKPAQPDTTSRLAAETGVRLCRNHGVDLSPWRTRTQVLDVGADDRIEEKPAV